MKCFNMLNLFKEEFNMHWKKDGCPGVYRLQNLKNGNFYIGSTRNLYRRWKRHQQVLREQLPENIRMLEDSKKLGWKSFCFGVIEYCDENELLEKEQYYYEKMKPFYNVWKHVYNAEGRKYTKRQLKIFKENKHPIKDREKFREKLREAWKKRKASMSPEDLKEVMGEKFRGKKHSKETKEAYSKKRKGIPKSEEMKEKMRLARKGTKLVKGKWVRFSNGL
ncbi:MAG: GIY-YIG nuclease family protein [Bacteroidales bacterium]